MNTHPAVEAAISLQSLIREHLVEGEERARLTPEVVTAVGKAGLFRLYAPREVGGFEMLPSDAIAAIEAVSAADPAVGWYMANSMPAGHIAAALAEQERTALFAEPDRHFGFSGAPYGQGVPSGGGYRVSGQWPVVTGCEDAKWCALSGAVMDGDQPREVNGQPDGRIFLMPTSELTIMPTWQKAGAMRGTGSNAVQVQDVFVPEELAYSTTKPLVIDRPLYRVPISVLFYPVGTAVIFGVLSTALETTQEELSTKVSSFSGQAQRDQAPIQEMIANSRAALRAVRAGLREVVDELDEVISKGAELSNELKADIYASCFYAGDVARETISQLYARGTRAGFLLGHPVERALRNIHAIAFSYEVTRPMQHSAGRVFLGGEPVHPAF